MIPGRLVLPALRWREDTGFSHEEPAIQQALDFGAGGFILFGGTRETVRDLTARLRRAAGRPLLIAADLERGAGQQVRGLAELPPPLALASLEEDAVIRGAGLMTGVQALSVGINWVLAPVADLDLEPENPIVQTRSFGADPERVADLVAGWIAGCQEAGALACVKHFPGHGRTRLDSHDAVPVVRESGDELASDLLPFQAAVGAEVASVMTAHVAFPGLDPEGRPATFSPTIIALLREGFRHEGLVVSDALMMAGATAGRGPLEAARDALRAGVDLLLYPEEAGRVAAEVTRLTEADPLVRDRVERAIARYERALAAVGPPLPEGTLDESGSAVAVADWLLARGPFRGGATALQAPLELVIVDDDVGERYPPSSSPEIVTEILRSRGVPLGSGGSRLVLVFAEPRASKGRASLSRASRDRLGDIIGSADLVIVFAHPRIAAEIPPGPPVVLAWHRQRAMQEAAGRWLAERIG